MVTTFQKDVLVANELLGKDDDDNKADATWEALDDQKKTDFGKTADRQELISGVVQSLVGDKDNPGVMTTMVTSTLGQHTSSIDEMIGRVINEKLDKRGLPNTPGFTPPKDDKKPKDDKPPEDRIPIDAVPRSEFDEKVKELEQGRLRESIMQSVGTGKFVNAEAQGDARDFLLARAELKDGKTIVVLTSEDKTTGAEIKTEHTVATAVEKLRELRPHWFATDVPGGSGGGGGELGDKKTDGKDPLPRVSDYKQLLDNPNLMARYLNEDNKTLEELQAAYFAGKGGELGDVLQGKGIDTRSRVERTLANLKQNMSKAQGSS